MGFNNKAGRIVNIDRYELVSAAMNEKYLEIGKPVSIVETTEKDLIGLEKISDFIY